MDESGLMYLSVLPFVAMILTGGLGTRLRPVVSDRPKPMALVEGVPFLEILIDCLAGKGVRDFVLLTGYKADMIESGLGQRSRGDLNLRFSHEHIPLGTGGAVRHASRFCTNPSLVVNGDTFFDADLEMLYRFHLEKKAAVTLSLMRVDDESRYGSVCLEDDGRISGFKEKSETPGRPGLINAGLSLMSKDFILKLPEDVAFSMERDIFPAFARTGKLFGLLQDQPFFDIGTPESYEAFRAYARDMVFHRRVRGEHGDDDRI